MLLRAAFIGLLLCAPFSLLAATTPPATVNNYDSCDISATPAATLLLPYFEVDTAAPQGAGTTTLFTVVNTSRYPQIAHVTVWTDWAYPVLSFNVFLTGYDVQGINLFDVIVRGFIARAPSGTSVTTVPGTPQYGLYGSGSTPLDNTANPNFILTGAADVRQSCKDLPGVLQRDVATAVKNALTSGTGYVSSAVSCGTGQVGFNHGTMAKGYITIDVVSYCTDQLPTDSNYYAGANAPLLFDNVLTGDYQEIGPAPAGSVLPGFDAEGGPMVPIHAVPEGGPSGAGGGLLVDTNLPFTFYDRYTPLPARSADRRQPLPSTWTSRYIQGGPAGFTTDLKIWREGIIGGLPNCRTSGAFLNSDIRLTEIVRFDEHENSYGYTVGGFTVSEFTLFIPSFPATSRTGTTSSSLPRLTGTDIGGWLYLNLSSGARDGGFSQCHPVLSAQRSGFGTCSDLQRPGDGGSRTTSQNWVITSMFGTVGINRLSVDFDPMALGNGCTPAPPVDAAIGPATQKSGLVCPNNAKVCSNGTFPPPVNP